MATTKTLTPTNQAITLAAFTEKPDNRTNVMNDDKLADAVNALNSKLTVERQNCTINSTYLKEGNIIAFKIGNLVLVQFTDMKFKLNLPSSAESNGIVLATLPFNVSLSQVIFVVVQLSTTYSAVRLKIQGNAIYPWWSSIKETTGEGYCGNVVINIPT